MTLLIPTTDIAPACTPSSPAAAPLASRKCRLRAVRSLMTLREHSLTERDLLDRLHERLTVSQSSEITVQYAERLQRGPTPPALAHAPHRHCPPSGLSALPPSLTKFWTSSTPALSGPPCPARPVGSKRTPPQRHRS